MLKDLQKKGKLMRHKKVQKEREVRVNGGKEKNGVK